MEVKQWSYDRCMWFEIWNLELGIWSLRFGNWILSYAKLNFSTFADLNLYYAKRS
jgi:hypothetical protein